jgi:hypothetical protein
MKWNDGNGNTVTRVFDKEIVGDNLPLPAETQHEQPKGPSLRRSALQHTHRSDGFSASQVQLRSFYAVGECSKQSADGLLAQSRR